MENAKFTLFIDLLPEGLRIEHDAYQTLPPEFLALPGMTPRWFGTNIRTELSGGVTESLHMLEKLLTLLPPLEETHVVLGICEDPFHAGISGFLSNLQLLKLLKSKTPYRVEIQTRSPLILLLTPLLKSFGTRSEVVMSLECIDDRSSSYFTPAVPRTSERLAASRALKRAGIPISIQLLPVLPRNFSLEKAKKFARILAAFSDHIFLLDEVRGTVKNADAALPVSDSVRLFSEIFFNMGNEGGLTGVKSGVQLFREAA